MLTFLPFYSRIHLITKIQEKGFTYLYSMVNTVRPSIVLFNLRITVARLNNRKAQSVSKVITAKYYFNQSTMKVLLQTFISRYYMLN